MRTLDIKDNFPVLEADDGAMLSRRGDITFGWQMTLPPLFCQDDSDYMSIISTFKEAVASLPDYTLVHKQDLFFKREYYPDSRPIDFLDRCFWEHFHGKEYLDHTTRLFLAFSQRSLIKEASSGLLGFGAVSVFPSEDEINKDLSASRKFSSIMSGCPLISLRPLSREEIFGRADKGGILQNYLNLRGEDCPNYLSDIEISPSRVKSGDRYLGCYLIAGSDCLPAEILSSRVLPDLSNDSCSIVESFLGPLGMDLPCDHILNQYILKEPSSEIVSHLEGKCRKMAALSSKSSSNRISSEEIRGFLDSCNRNLSTLVKTSFSVMVISEEESLSREKEQVALAFSKMRITPSYDIYDTPHQFWASIPGNESGLGYGDFMTMELGTALCIGLYESLDRGEDKGILQLCPRSGSHPLLFDIQEEAFRRGIIHNYNAFVLGPSGSGKSFFMNKYLQRCYSEGRHCLVVDIGNSYRTLCGIVSEESKGRHGAYFPFEKDKPLSFNPFRSFRKGCVVSPSSLRFLFILVCTLWKRGEESIPPAGQYVIEESLKMFSEKWKLDRPAIFQDYFDFILSDYWNYLREVDREVEGFEIGDFVSALRHFSKSGTNGYLLNSGEDIDILSNRFVVFEIGNIKDDPLLYPITTLVMMDAFYSKMKEVPDMKVMVIEEAWSALRDGMMAQYMLEVWKTARKFRTSAVAVTQELGDVISSPLLKESVLENSDVKILLSQGGTDFSKTASALSLSEKHRAQVLSMGKNRKQSETGNELFISLGSKIGRVFRLEVSKEETIAFSSDRMVREDVEKKKNELGSYIAAIKKMTEEGYLLPVNTATIDDKASSNEKRSSFISNTSNPLSFSSKSTSK